MPAFWDNPYHPMITHTSPKQDKFKVTKLKKIAKLSNLEILRETLHVTHLLKFRDKMYEYEKDPTRTVGATERTRGAGRTDGRMEWNQYILTTLLCGGYNYALFCNLS